MSAKTDLLYKGRLCKISAHFDEEPLVVRVTNPSIKVRKYDIISNLFDIGG
jgi:hypothetical protein